MPTGAGLGVHDSGVPSLHDLAAVQAAHVHPDFRHAVQVVQAPLMGHVQRQPVHSQFVHFAAAGDGDGLLPA